MKADAQTLVPIGLVGFYVYRRVRRSIGFQPFRPKSMMVRLAILGLLGILFLAMAAIFQPSILTAAGLGVLAGGILAFYAVRHLVQEWRGDRLFIKTHIVIESTVLALFLGRLAYRFLVGTVDPVPGAGLSAIKFDPFTIGFFYVIVAYYFGYFGWLLLIRNELLERSGKRVEASEG